MNNGKNCGDKACLVRERSEGNTTDKASLIHTGWMVLFWFIFGIIIQNTPLNAQHVPDSLLWEALANHPAMNASNAAVSQQDAVLNQQGFWTEPSLQLGFGVLPIETRLGPQQMRIGIQQAIPRIGSLRLQQSRAQGLKQAEEWQRLEQALQIRLQLEQLLTEYRLSQQLLGAQEQLLNTIRNKEVLLIEAIGNEQSEFSSLLRFQQQKELAHSDSVQTRILQDRVLRTIERITKVNTSTIEVWINGNEPNVEWNKETSTHPRILKQDAMLSASSASLELNQQKYLPAVVVGLDYWLIGERSNVQLANNGRDVLAPSIGFQLPIFRKKIDAQVQEIRSQQEVIKQQRSAISLELENALDEAYSQLQMLDAQMKSIQNQLQLLDNERSWMKQKLRSNAGSLGLINIELEIEKKAIELLKIQRDRQLIQSRINYLNAAELLYLQNIINELSFQN